MKFRKTIAVEAEQYLLDGPMPFEDDGYPLEYDEDSHSHYINTLEGKMTVSPGDWIIKGISGEFYPCKPDIFAITYEPVAVSS